jgi:steroid delta-isomerase-like uncharacterized protein
MGFDVGEVHPEDDLAETATPEETMSTEPNKAIIKRYYEEVLNGRKLDLIDQLAVEDYVEHDPFPGQGNGRNDLRARAELILGAFDPLRFTVEDVIAEGDRVVVRWSQVGTQSGAFMGMPPTGREFGINGIDIHALRDGRMAEHWHVVDQLGMLQQLGAIPAPSEASA